MATQNPRGHADAPPPGGPSALADTLILLCRPGFEKECAAEIVDRLQGPGVACHARAEPGSALVEVRAAADWNARRVLERLRFRELIFARDWFAGRRFDALAAGDRIAPLVRLAEPYGRLRECRLQHLDTAEGRSVGKLCTRLQARLDGALSDAGAFNAKSLQRLQLLFLSGASGFIGVAPVANGALWSMGIPRLRLAGAPSRAAAKLEEALLWFLGAEAATELRAGMHAADLGAAPGGWSWQLARREIFVTAVDRGALAPELLAMAQIEHRRADAFRYEPPQPVDWMVCDIVDKPARVAELVVRWFARGWCRRSIFNLKLPMKRRFHECTLLLARIRVQLGQCSAPLRIEARQLYHDREEITVCIRAIE